MFCLLSSKLRSFVCLSSRAVICALQLYSAWLGLKGERLKRAAVSLLESLASLALEVNCWRSKAENAMSMGISMQDNKLVGHWGNCLAYLDAGLTALQVSFLPFLLDGVCIFQALGRTNYLMGLEHLSKTRVINLTSLQSVNSSPPISGVSEIPEIQHKQSACARE